MADKKDIALRAGIEVDPSVASASGKALDPWQSKAREVGRTIKNEFESAAKDILRVVTVANAISFGKAMDDARRYRDEIGRLAVPAGPVGQLRMQIETISRAKLIPEREIMAAQRGIGRITYDFKGALDAVVALNDEALQTGESLGDKLPLGVTLMQGLGVAGAGVGKELQRVRALAEDLGTPGGATALEDALGNVKDLLTQISTKTDEDRAKLEALTAGIGKGFSAPAAQRAAQRLLGDVAADPRGYERFLGMKRGALLDEQGHVKDPLAVLEATRNKILKQAGGNVNEARFLAQGTYGYEGAAALFSADFGAMRKAAAGGRLSQVASRGAADFAASEAGQAAARQQEQERNARKTAEGMLPIADAAQGILAAHPILGSMGLNMGGNLAVKGIGAVLEAGGKALLGGSRAVEVGGTVAGASMAAGGRAAGASLAGGGTGLLGKLGLLGAAGAAGYAAGSALDDEAGISDTIAGVHGSQKLRDKYQDDLDTNDTVAASREKRKNKVRDAAMEVLGIYQNKGTVEGFDRSIAPHLGRMIQENPAVGRIVEGLHNGGAINVSGLSKESTQGIEDAIKEMKVSVTVITDPDNPIVANAAQHAKTSRN